MRPWTRIRTRAFNVAESGLADADERRLIVPGHDDVRQLFLPRPREDLIAQPYAPNRRLARCRLDEFLEARADFVAEIVVVRARFDDAVRLPPDDVDPNASLQIRRQSKRPRS